MGFDKTSINSIDVVQKITEIFGIVNSSKRYC